MTVTAETASDFRCRHIIFTQKFINQSDDDRIFSFWRHFVLTTFISVGFEVGFLGSLVVSF